MKYMTYTLCGNTTNAPSTLHCRQLLPFRPLAISYHPLAALDQTLPRLRLYLLNCLWLLEPTPVTELGLSCFLLGNDHSRGENVLLDALKLPSYGPIEHWRVDLHATGEILVVDALQPQ